MADANQILEQNANANTNQVTMSRAEMLATLQLLRAAGRLPDMDTIECPTQ
jgi:hypothetical protein